jgi:hypothetical protein
MSNQAERDQIRANWNRIKECCRWAKEGRCNYACCSKLNDTQHCIRANYSHNVFNCPFNQPESQQIKPTEIPTGYQMVCQICGQPFKFSTIGNICSTNCETMEKEVAAHKLERLIYKFVLQQTNGDLDLHDFAYVEKALEKAIANLSLSW